MDNGLDVNSLEESTNEVELWESGQDILPNQSEQSSLELAQYVAQYVAESQAESSLEYELGAYEGYSMTDFGMLYGAGMGAGFAVAICVGLASWVVALAISILKKGGNE